NQGFRARRSAGCVLVTRLAHNPVTKNQGFRGPMRKRIYPRLLSGVVRAVASGKRIAPGLAVGAADASMDNGLILRAFRLCGRYGWLRGRSTARVDDLQPFGIALPGDGFP